MTQRQFRECLDKPGAVSFLMATNSTSDNELFYDSQLFLEDGEADGNLTVNFKQILALFLPKLTRRELTECLALVERDEKSMKGLVLRQRAPRQLPKDKRDEILQIFGSWDINSNGIIDRVELQECMQAAGFLQSQVDAMFSEFDADGDGQLDAHEFLNAMSRCYI